MAYNIPVSLPLTGGDLLGTLTNTFPYLFKATPLTTTMSQTGILATISGISSIHSGAYVIPATGSPFSILSYQGTTTVPTSVSQTISSGTSCTLFYYPHGAPFDAYSAASGLISLLQNVRYVGIGSPPFTFLKLSNGASNTFSITSSIPIAPSNSSNQAASQSGTTVTGVGTSWDSTYKGHMIRFATGETAWITDVAGSTSMTVTPSQTVATTDFDIPGKTTSFEAVSADAHGNFGAGNVYVNSALINFGAAYFAKRAVTATPDTASATDYTLLVNVASAVTENIPAATGSGRILIIKDESGSASTNNITIVPASGTIDGASTLVISINYGSYTIQDGSSGKWSII